MEYVPSILDLLDLEYIEETLYRGCAVSGEPRRLYGGQVAAQALYAAGRTVPAGRLPHSLHGYFLRPGSRLRPTVFPVDRDRDGHSFSARRVVAIQDGEVIFNMSASFAAPQAARTATPRPLSFPREIRCPAGACQAPVVRVAYGDRDHPAAACPVLAPLHGRTARRSVAARRRPRLHLGPLELEPHAVSGGRGWYTGASYAADGSRIASFAQEQLFRTLRPVRPEPSFGTSG